MRLALPILTVSLTLGLGLAMTIAVLLGALLTRTIARPVTAMTQNKPALPSSAQLAWIQAYQESQRQTAELLGTSV